MTLGPMFVFSSLNNYILTFGKDTILEEAHLNNIMVEFEDAYGMIVNKNKLHIYFFHTHKPI